MRSIGGVQRTEGVGGEVVDRNHGLRRPPIPVWVLLDRLYERGPGQPEHHNAAGVDLAGRVPGLLSRWIPTYQGSWVGQVTFEVEYADGRRHSLSLQDQLVPDYAFRPREDSPRGNPST